MDSSLFEWVLNIPSVVAGFGSWLTNPIYPPYIDISPLGLFGLGGVGVIIAIIGVHVVRLFI